MKLVVFIIGIVLTIVSSIILVLNTMHVYSDWYLALIMIPIVALIGMFIFGPVAFRTESILLTSKLFVCAVILLITAAGPFMIYNSMVQSAVWAKDPSSPAYAFYLSYEMVNLAVGLNLLAVIIGGYGVVAES